MHKRRSIALPLHPLLIFSTILLVIFAVEIGVMFLLPTMLPRSLRWIEAVVDASLLVLVLAPMLWIWVVRPLQYLAEARAELLEQTIQAQEEERRRIARDLHDGIGQTLTSLLVGLRTLEESNTLEQARDQAGGLRHLAGSVYDEIRQLARGLRPSILDDLGFFSALERLVEDFEQAHQVRVTLEAPREGGPRLPWGLETALYRIVQEALTNVAKHAKARHVKIDVSLDRSWVTLTIMDNGCGFQPAELLRDGKSSFGLSSMRERAAILGGSLECTSQPGMGTTLHVRIPREE